MFLNVNKIHNLFQGFFSFGNSYFMIHSMSRKMIALFTNARFPLLG